MCKLTRFAVLEDYTHYLVVMLDAAPDLLFASPSFPASFEVILVGLTSYHAEIIIPSVDFVFALLSHDALSPSTTSSGPPPPSFPHYATAIRALISEQGFRLVGILLTGLLTNFDEQTSITAAVLFKRMAELWPQELLSWLPAALERLTSSAVTPATRSNIVSAFAT